ncbi:hypothetical protein TREMEDRAFT_73111 [Tremella mesenterica DSM 1558]|uniref:uncharacterized protein n=1 Tax=Tremella mesenterica (strain ATCC 24925 / CBS 8224 / DSM 1558 / NBRC 9311 / NRRL Y-6157 / RJB 2259-6 / UBC 559-6) TaxID=578456 RepID=UPI0003F49209|nr:uncharacterized protein TREMEDRAFT_73111 [Tremella mesenterica DSM 1558]EIW73607.1 hypothetical protein TREMEDRAFT_73111 [Tremella mesenterica DSM 1558]
MADDDSWVAEVIKQLDIKKGSLQRLWKEEQLYLKEVAEAQAQLDKLKQEGADGADVRNAAKIQQEAIKMVWRSRESTGQALRELIVFLDGSSGEELIMNTQSYQSALALSEEVTAASQAEINKRDASPSNV